LDLIVTCTGNDYPNQESKYPVRFYINNGKGVFAKKSFIGNKILISAGAIAVQDYDKNGKQDIFIGGRIIPGHYGKIPSSFLLSLDGDSLHEITPGSLKKAGMVTSAQWNDIDGNGWSDLIICGEWMPITLFSNFYGKLNNANVIENSYGWWNRIICSDIDSDGDNDLIAGNLGMNTRYRGTLEKPVTMIVSDFDDNGSTDCMISVYVKDKSYPISLRDYVLDQMPYLRKKFLRNRPYTTATIEDIFSEDQLLKADKFMANEMNTLVFINSTNDGFVKKILPVEAQLFSVNGIQVTDVNEDKIPDLLFAGNNYNTEVETGRNDAGIGLVLIGKGNGEFTSMPPINSGFYIPGDVKCLEKITINGKAAYIAGKNSEPFQIVQSVK
jgi:hypothetical protein